MKLFKIKFEKTEKDVTIKDAGKKAVALSGKALKASGNITGKGLKFTAGLLQKVANKLEKKGEESK